MPVDPKTLDDVEVGLQIAFPKNDADEAVVVGDPNEDVPPKIEAAP